MGAPTAVHGAQDTRETEPEVSQPLVSWVVLGVVGSMGMVLAGTRIGAVADPRLARWWFSLPAAASPLHSVVFYLSVALLVGAWLGLGRVARAGQLTLRRAWTVLVLWGIPLVVGPPLFSRDLFSYVGQGLLAHRGLNPYTVAPSTLGPGPLLSGIASVWRHTTSPYGPLFVWVSRGVASVAGGSLDAQIVAYRALEVVGVVLVMVFLPRLARHLGTDPGVALWLGALSPLALFGFVASGHNDALMVGLLVAGVTLGVTGRLVPGLALCALAATVKLPAAAGVVFLAAEQMGRLSGSRRWRVFGEAVAVMVVVPVVVTLLAGYGWTWLGPTALHIPTELRVLSTPSVSVGVFIFAVLHPLGLPVARSAVVTVTQDVVVVFTVAAVVWLLATLRRHEVVRSLGLALVLIVMGSPTVWPWYLTWGVILLAATSAQRSKGLVAVAALAMLVVGPSGHPLLVGDWYVAVTLGTVALVAWMVRGGRWRSVVDGHAA